MTQLAIKGHPFLCKKVIEILEMLGGKNTLDLAGYTQGLYYYINNDNIITQTSSLCKISKFKIFTVEEFYKKFPYKVGDKVQHKGATSCGSVYEVEKMRWACTHVEYTVKRLWYHNGYSVVTAENLQLYKETMEERKYADLKLDVDQDDQLATEVTIGGGKITPPENYLIGKVTAVDNGLLVEFIKKQPQYPKTYEECCKVLGYEPDEDEINCYQGQLIKPFVKLLICRDAYWKIEGEQMGLGKLWEPDWAKDIEKYVIYPFQYLYSIDVENYRNTILAFPTREMRDAFYENFKDLIEQCKELL